MAPLKGRRKDGWTALRGKLWLKHVKGHSGQRWNDRADALANSGRNGVVSVHAVPVE